MSLARLAELRLNAVCAIHFQIVHEMDASSFNPVVGWQCLASRVRSHQEEYGRGSGQKRVEQCALWSGEIRPIYRRV